MLFPDLPPLNGAASKLATSRFAASKPGSMTEMQATSNHQHYSHHRYSDHRCSSPTGIPVENQPRLKILLAEDNLTNQKLVLRQLQFLGYQADVVATGRDAVAAVMRSGQDQSGYDIVLMDCQMPILNGFEATLAIRSWERQTAPHIKPIVIIAMTASSLEQDQERAIAVGMNDYLMKPIHKETLESLLHRWHETILNHTSGQYRFSGSTKTELHCEPESHQFDTSGLHLNLNHLHILSDNTPEFELELLQLFVNDSNAHLKRLQHALVSQDFEQIERIAHHLKGASANVGAMIMQQAAETIEKQASHHQGDRLHTLATTLETSLKRIQLFMGLQAEYETIQQRTV